MLLEWLTIKGGMRQGRIVNNIFIGRGLRFRRSMMPQPNGGRINMGAYVNTKEASKSEGE